MSHYFIFSPISGQGIPNSWQAFTLIPPAEPGGEGSWAEMPTNTQSPGGCVDCRLPAIGEIFETNYSESRNELTLYYFSQITKSHYEIDGYKETESQTTEVMGGEEKPTTITDIFAPQEGSWTDLRHELAHLLPSNDTYGGYYWYYNSCDIIGKFHNSDLPNQVFESRGSGWSPCFFPSMIVPPEYSTDGDYPNWVSGYVDQIQYRYSWMTLSGYLVGGVAPPVIGGEVIGGSIFPGGGGDDGVRRKQVVNTEENVMVSIKSPYTLNLTTNFKRG